MATEKSRKMLTILVGAAVVILLAILTVVLIVYLDYKNDRNAAEFAVMKETTMARIRAVNEAVISYTYSTNNDEYPLSLYELITPPSDPRKAEKWDKLLDEIPVDSWGTKLQYEIRDGRGYVYSCGPDKKPHTDDDFPLFK